MSNKQSTTTAKKLHPRSKHLKAYNFKTLAKVNSDLNPYVHKNEFGTDSIDFNNPNAVRELNKSLLAHHYDIKYWNIPRENLVPPIPGRADYLHYIADFLAAQNNGKIPRGKKVNILDIGVGANCIYPIIGKVEYGWSFVGTEIIKKAYKNALEIVQNNEQLREDVHIRLQENNKFIFRDVIKDTDKFEISICNPPFFGSQTEALAQSARKQKNKTVDPEIKTVQSFGGQGSELWHEGGEKAFLITMINESRFYKDQIKWFSTIVAHRENVRTLEYKLKKVNAKNVQTIRMEQGNKVTRILIWQF